MNEYVLREIHKKNFFYFCNYLKELSLLLN